MNNFDLDSQLKALRTPERSEEYWEDFPRRVTGELRRRPLSRPARSSSWLKQVAWGFSLAFGCFVLGYCLGHNDVSRGISRAWLENQREIVKLHAQIRTFDEHGVRKLLTDQP
jgi:hypothetical protein